VWRIWDSDVLKVASENDKDLSEKYLE